MAWQRKTPFGYMIQNGEIIRHPQESGAVRDIFARYLLGESYSQIAGEMERLGIRCALLTGSTPAKTKKSIAQQLAHGGMALYAA